MSAAQNTRDAILQAATTRTTNPLDATLILRADTQTFHVDKDGANTPGVINLTATMILLDGTVSFSASSGTVKNVSQVVGTRVATATYAYADMATASAVITASVTSNGQTFSVPLVITKQLDGLKGDNGPAGAGTGIAYLYQWASAAPAAPAGTSTFDWTTGANTAYSNTDNWRTVAPANPGTPGIMLWVAAKPITAPGGTSSSTVAYNTGAVVTAYTQNGKDGAAGVKSAIVRAYQWVNGAAPTATGSATYTWATGLYDSVPTVGWTKTKGNAPAKGYTLYEASVSLLDTAGSAQSSINWTSAAIVAVGYVGVDGVGSTGASAAIAYTLVDGFTLNATPSLSQVNAKALPTTGTWGETRAWTAQPSVPSAGQSVFQSNGIYDPATDKTTWGLPYLSALRVGSLSAITANLGAVTAGSIDIGNGTAVIDAAGNATFTSLTIKRKSDGLVLLTTNGTGSIPDGIATAATTANWSGVSGSGKPENGATVGADATNLKATIGGDNLTFNSSFERMSNGYLADGWSVYNNGGSNEPTTAYKAPGRTGANAQGISWTGTHFTTKGIHGQVNSLGWIPGKTYTVAFWAMTTNISELLGISLQWNTWPASTVEVSNPAVTSTWQRYVFRITWGGSVEGSGQGYISINTGSLSGNVIFDDFMVVEGDVAPAYYPSAAEAATIATGVTVNPDGSLNNAGGGKPTLPGMGQNVYRVVARGLQANTGPAAGLWKNGTVALGAKRSYFVAMIRRSDGVIEASEYFDVYGNGEQANGRNAASMAAMLNGYGSDYIVIVWTYDEPYNYRLTAGLEAAMYRCGASRAVYGSSQFVLNSAYVLIGVPGCGEGNGAEAYQGSVNYDPNAWVEMTMTLVNGAFTVSPGYTPRTLKDYGYVGDMNATKGAPAGTYVNYTLAETVESWASQGSAAYSAISGMQVAIADKLSQSSANILRAPITLTTGGGVVVGSLTYDSSTGLRTGGSGIAITPYGLLGHNGTKYTFGFDGGTGNAWFGGELQAAYGSFGRVTVASNGGSISTPNYTGYAWPSDGSTGFWLGPEGLILGNPSTGQWFLVNAKGEIDAPGFSFKFGQLTLTSPVLVNPKTQTSFSATMSSLILNNQVNTSTYQNYSKGPVISGGTVVSYLWSFDVEEGNIRMTSDPTAATANIQARGINAYASGWLSLTVRDSNGATATASCRVAIQFGSGAPQ